LVIFTNFLPKVSSNDAGTWDRLVLLPFNARFRDTEGEVKNYGDYLFQHCGGAVLSWLIEGARQFIANGHTLGQLPQCVLDATAEYRDGNDWLSEFLADCCDIERQYNVGSGELYKVFRAWCARQGEFTRSAAEFSRAVKARGFDVRKTKTGARVFGVRVNSNTLGAEYAS
jgi:phage/plasmid-associated DNA primase